MWMEIFIYMNMDSWLLWQVNSPQKRNKQQTLSIPLHIAGFNHQALRMTVLTALTVSLQHNSETGSNPSFWANCYNSKIPKSECFWHVGDTGWRLGVEMSEHSHWSSCRSADDAPWHSCFCHIKVTAIFFIEWLPSLCQGKILERMFHMREASCSFVNMLVWVCPSIFSAHLRSLSSQEIVACWYNIFWHQERSVTLSCPILSYLSKSFTSHDHRTKRPTSRRS